MGIADSKPRLLIPPAAPAARAPENFRAKSIATRLTEAEFAEIEAVAASAGKKVAEWLRDAALDQARAAQEVKTDPILLAELMSLRTLTLNLFSAASKGPLNDESIRKLSAYAESVKQKKADEFLAKLRAKSGTQISAAKP